MTQQAQSGTTIKIRVQPKASKDEILGYRGDTLMMRVTAPPEDGRANAAVISLLASKLGIARSSIDIVKGKSSRDKLVKVESLGQEEVQHRLGNLPS